MKIEEAKIELEQLTSCELEEFDGEILENILGELTYQNLIEFCNDVNEFNIVEKNINTHSSIFDWKIKCYASSSKYIDYSGFIILMDDDSVFGYGYTTD